MINSLLNDGDLNLANNYAAVHAGAQQAGLNFAGVALDDHTVWYQNGRRWEWPHVYEIDEDLWRYNAAGHPVPTLRPGQTPPAPGHPEYSTHPPGIALLLAPLLFPFPRLDLCGAASDYLFGAGGHRGHAAVSRAGAQIQHEPSDCRSGHGRHLSGNAGLELRAHPLQRALSAVVRRRRLQPCLARKKPVARRPSHRVRHADEAAVRAVPHSARPDVPDGARPAVRCAARVTRRSPPWLQSSI